MKNRVLRSYTVSTISIALVLFVLGAIGYFMASVLTSSQSVREGITMIVELKDDLTPEHRDSLTTLLRRDDMVASVEFVSKEDKLADEEFRKAFDVDIKGILGKNPLPDSFDVCLSALAADKEARTAFIERCQSIDGVSHISYPETLLERTHAILDTMQLLLAIFGGAMLLISLILLYNTIRLAIFSRREAINTMKLVGATKWFIIKPFLRNSALQGLCAGIVAALLLVGTLYGLDQSLPELGIAKQGAVVATIIGAMVGIGVSVAVLFTLLTVNRFVNMQSNKIHLY